MKKTIGMLFFVKELIKIFQNTYNVEFLLITEPF